MAGKACRPADWEMLARGKVGVGRSHEELNPHWRKWDAARFAAESSRVLLWGCELEILVHRGQNWN